MTTADPLERGRSSFADRAWAEAHHLLSAADRDRDLTAPDLELLATAAYLIGLDEESADAWGRAHRGWLHAGEDVRAVRCAFWAAFGLLIRGEHARGGGWLGKAHRLLHDVEQDCVERGYLLVPSGLQGLATGDAVAALAAFEQAIEIGTRFADPDLTAFGLLGRGQSLVRFGKTVEGVALLDEVMVEVTTGEVSAVVAGIVYCAVIEACREICDVRRAQEWTAALTRWCAVQPDLVPYRGQCQVYRAEILCLHGAWPDALAEAARACERLAGHPAAGMAWYQKAEVHRLRGELADAEAAYLRAAETGADPQPGLALLWLARGALDAADVSIRRSIAGTADTVTRSRLLAAFVEIVLAAGDVAAAGEAAAELGRISGTLDAPLLHAVAAQARGAVLLARGDARAACEALREAGSRWQELAAPYEQARVRELLARACTELGDDAGARLESDIAHRILSQLGNAATGVAAGAAGLTGREREVLALVAAGASNREVARELVLSEHTVRRHLQNIFAKLQVSSRTAATAYAFRSGIV